MVFFAGLLSKFEANAFTSPLARDQVSSSEPEGVTSGSKAIQLKGMKDSPVRLRGLSSIQGGYPFVNSVFFVEGIFDSELVFAGAGVQREVVDVIKER